MIRILVFLVVIALLAFGVGWLIDRPGSLVLVWQGWQIETTVPVALLAVALLTAALLVLWWFFRTLFHIPDALSGFVQGRRRKRGLTAIAHGLVAIGVGDGRAARRSATEARRLIGDEPLTLLLRAQAAQLSGDKSEAEAAFRAMLDQDETRSLGYRGLFVEARRRGDEGEALQTALRATRSDPRVPWAGPALLELQAASRDWDGALAAVESNVAAKLIDRLAGRRQRAVLLTAKAIEIADEKPDYARELATNAVELAPDLVPAAALAGRLLAEAGDARKAARVVEKAWRAQPHPDLAEVYLHLRPGDAALDRLKRAQQLFNRSGGDVEGALALGRAAMDAREYALARKTLTPLVEAGATRRVCLLMAELDDAEYDDRSRARAWLARALVASPDPAWIADGVVSQDWHPFSPVSGKLDAYVWAVPQVSLSAPDSRLIEAEIVVTESARPNEDPVVAPSPPADLPPSESVVQPELPVASEPPSVTPEQEEIAVSRPPARRKRTAFAAPAPVDVLLPLARAPDDPGPDAEDVPHPEVSTVSRND